MEQFTLLPFALLTERKQRGLPPPYQTWILDGGETWASFHRLGQRYIVRFPGLADFEVASDGKAVACRPCPGLPAATCDHLYLNQVYPLMLSRQGRLAFHASAVEEGEGAIIFAGASGRGKSTLAAAFAVAGAGYLSDDAVELECRMDTWFALPGPPSIRLWDDSRRALLGENAELAPSVSYSAKARILSADRLTHSAASRRLAAAFFLGRDEVDTIAIRPLTGARAVAAWTAHSFLLDTREVPGLVNHLGAVARLAEAVPCYALDYPRRYDLMDCLRSGIRDTLAGAATRT